MELTPEEYGEYWGASIRVAAGVLAIFFGYQLASPLLAHSEAGATGLGFVLLVGIVLVGCYAIVLGFARAIRVAVDAEMRR